MHPGLLLRIRDPLPDRLQREFRADHLAIKDERCQQFPLAAHGLRERKQHVDHRALVPMRHVQADTAEGDCPALPFFAAAWRRHPFDRGKNHRGGRDGGGRRLAAPLLAAGRDRRKIRPCPKRRGRRRPLLPIPDLLKDPAGVRSEVLVFKISAHNPDNGVAADGRERFAILPSPAMRRVGAFLDGHLRRRCAPPGAQLSPALEIGAEKTG
jgi:hypothetical protein